jgi:hypothetical protein
MDMGMEITWPWTRTRPWTCPDTETDTDKVTDTDIDMGTKHGNTCSTANEEAFLVKSDIVVSESQF